MNMNLQPLTTQAGLTPSILEERKNFIGLEREDIAELVRLHAPVEAMASAVVEDFYTVLSKTDEFRALVTDSDTMGRMRSTLHGYVTTLFAGHYDMSYARDRMRVGTIHFRIGISESLLIAALYRLILLIEGRLRATELIDHPPEAIRKVFLFDLQLVLDAYVQGYLKQTETARWETARQFRDDTIAPQRERANLFSTPSSIRTDLRKD